MNSSYAWRLVFLCYRVPPDEYNCIQDPVEDEEVKGQVGLGSQGLPFLALQSKSEQKLPDDAAPLLVETQQPIRYPDPLEPSRKYASGDLGASITSQDLGKGKKHSKELNLKLRLLIVLLFPFLVNAIASGVIEDYLDTEQDQERKEDGDWADSPVGSDQSGGGFLLAPKIFAPSYNTPERFRNGIEVSRLCLLSYSNP